MSDDDNEQRRRQRAVLDAVFAVPRKGPMDTRGLRLFIAAYKKLDDLELGPTPDDPCASTATRLDSLDRRELLELVKQLDRAHFKDHIPASVLRELSDAELRGLARALRRRRGEAC